MKYTKSGITLISLIITIVIILILSNTIVITLKNYNIIDIAQNTVNNYNEKIQQESNYLDRMQHLSINNSSAQMPYLDFVNATQYNIVNFENKSTENKGEYLLTSSSGKYEKINIPIRNCGKDIIYAITLSVQTPDATFSSSYKYGLSLSNSEFKSNTNINPMFPLIKDTENNEVTIVFSAITETVYLGMDLAALVDGADYTVLINTVSISTIDSEINNPNINFANTTAYNYSTFTNNSSSTGEYIMKTGNKYEKLNIPIENCIIGVTYEITVTLEVPNAQYINSHNYGYSISPNLVNTNSSTSCLFNCVKDTSSHSYTGVFTATSPIMYINFELSDLVNNNEYTINVSVSTQRLNNLPSPILDFANAACYNTGGFINNSTTNVGDFTLSAASGNYEKLNIPITNCLIGYTYDITFSMQVPDAIFSNSYAYNYKIDIAPETSNSNINFSNSLTRDTQFHSYTTSFTATNNTMYICFSISKLKDGYTFNLLFPEYSIK